MKTFDNAFAMLTDDPHELAQYNMRSDMMNAIIDIIDGKGWTQREAAERLKVSQSRVSNLKTGKINLFSIDMLMGMLSKLGFTFEFNYAVPVNGPVDVSMLVNTANALHP